MYLTYDEYTKMGGTLDPTAFNRCELTARKMVDKETFNRITTITEPIKGLMFDLVNASDIAKINQITGTGNDGVSISYSKADLSNYANERILFYLSGETDINGTPLLYRGVDI